MSEALRAAAAALLLCAASSCVRDDGFVCHTDGQCTYKGQAGRCEAVGFCSYADPRCASGRRFGAFAGASSNRCTEEADLAVPESVDGAEEGFDGSVAPGEDAALAVDEGSNVDQAPACAPLVAAALGIGERHGCARKSDGTVWCWGDNTYGQVGDGTVGGTRSRPVLVPQIANATKVVGGEGHGCALVNRQVWCWGRNSSGELGRGTFTPSEATPAAVPGLSTANDVDVGGAHTCVVAQVGAGTNVLCWGANGKGELGNNNMGTNSNAPQTVVVDVPGTALANATAVATGYEHSCALISDGTVRCWGRDDRGQLGGNSSNGGNPVVRASTAVQGLSKRINSLTAGRSHTCGLAVNATVFCWGENALGQLGDGAFEAFKPTAAGVLLTGALSVSARGDHTCARTTGLSCWGDNAFGELGDQSGMPFLRNPAQVKGLSGAPAEVGAAAQATCGRTAAGTLECWGRNASNEFGDGTSNDSAAPTPAALVCP